MVTCTSTDSTITCAFSGRLDAMTVMKDELAVQGELEQVRDRSVVFNLAQVAFVSSAFLRLCVKTAKVTGKERFSIRGCSPDVLKVFKISGLDQVLTLA